MIAKPDSLSAQVSHCVINNRLSNSDNISNNREDSLSSFSKYNDHIKDELDHTEGDSYERKTNKITASGPSTSTPDLVLSNNGPTKTINSDLTAKKSLSFDAFSPLSISSKLGPSHQSETENTSTSGNATKSKGKFVFKKPSRLTMDENKTTPNKDIPSSTAERIRNASEALKPVPTATEAPQCKPVPSSSVEFQPPQFSKSSLLNIHRQSTDSPRENEQDSDTIDDYEVPIDLDDVTDIIPESSQLNVINISDSVASTSNLEVVNNRTMSVDEDGWPEYRPEDFEENIEDLGNQKPEVINLMETSIVKDKTAKYEGMGDFHAGTKNDGITGKF